MALEVLTIGGAVRDITFFTEQGQITKGHHGAELLSFELGSKINLAQVDFNLGGGACNNAVAMARLGLKTAILVRVGSDREGEKIIQDLKAEEIDTHFIQVDKKQSTGFSFICGWSKKRNHIAFMYRGASESLEIKAAQLAKINTKWIMLSSLSNENWLDDLKVIKNWVARRKILWAWNPGNLQLQAGARILKPFLKNVEILALNESEAQRLIFSSENVLTRSPRESLMIMSDWGPRLIAVTMGAKGAYVLDTQTQELVFMPATKVKAIDATGAGDSFFSGLVAGWEIFKQNPQRALKLGILNSGSNATQIGAQNGLLTAQDLKKYFKI